MNYWTTFKINDHIYQIKDAMGVLTTLVIGEEKALLVDTGYGLYDLKKEISTLTNKQLLVIDSHGHMDHTGGNYLFDEVYIDQKDMELCLLHNSYEWRKKVLHNAEIRNLIDDTYDKDTFLNQRAGNIKVLPSNFSFNLGKVHGKIIPMEGHTKGSIGVLLEEDRILIVTDATCPFVWLFLEESCPVNIYIKMLERVLLLPFDYILLGHGAGTLLPKSKVVDFLNCAKSIDLKKAVKVTFNDFENLNSYCYTTGKMYDQNDVGVVFDPNKKEQI